MGPTGSSAGSSAGSTPGSTPTGSTPGSSSGSTSAASTSTGTTVAPTTESVEALSQKVNEAAATKAAAVEAINAAAETKAAAEEVGNALTSINLQDFVTRLRNKRQATTTTYATPSNCDDVKTAMVDITNALDGTNDA